MKRRIGWVVNMRISKVDKSSVYNVGYASLGGIREKRSRARRNQIMLAVAAGEMQYEELLDWILENEA